MSDKVKFIQWPDIFVAAVLIALFSAFAPAQPMQKEKDEAAIRALVDKINRAWQSEKPSTLFQEILSDKGFVFAMPKPDNPSEAAVINKQRFCELLDNIMQGQQRPQKHEHKVESITIIGPLAYEIGTSLDVRADGTERRDEVMNVFAKDETGWKLIHSSPTDNIRKALALSQNNISKTQKLSVEQTRNLEQNIEGSFSGIGVHIDAQLDGISVKRVIADGPADNAGLNAGDIITAIDGQPTRGMSLEQAVSLIKGPEGTGVKLKVRSADGVSRDVNVVRGTVVVTGCESRIIEPNIGLLTITAFTKQTSAEVRKTINHFQEQNVRALILDLRNNRGGFYPSVCEVAGMFVGQDKPLWQIQKIGQNQPIVVRAKQSKIVQWPVVVLIGSKTTCGGELLACALRTSGGAKLLGQDTFGHGSSSKLEKQADGSSKKVVGAYFFTAEGQAVDGQGIKPDRWIDSGTSPQEVLRQAVSELTRGEKL